MAPIDFQALVERSTDGVAVVAEGRYQYANAAWAAQLGRKAAELPGRSILDDVHPTQRETLDAWLTNAEPALDVEFRFLGAQGEIVALEVSPIPMDAGAGPPKRALVARNLTRLKRLQARLLLADRMMSVGALAAGVAHEINNPLSYVLGNLTFLVEETPALVEKLDRGQRSDILEALEEAQEGAERVRRIVRDLQSFSRADQEGRGVVEVNRIVESAINMAWIEIRHRARLKKELGPVPDVLASEGRFGQLILNLLLNAAHSLPEGSADAHEIRVVTREDEDGQAVIEIQDSGPGIPLEVLSHVFDPFFSTHQAGVGTGLGLSIAHSIVTELAGTIDAENVPGGGALFRVKLPAAGEGRGGTADLSGFPAQEGPSARILIVDDEALIAASLRRALRGHEVVVLQSGREAIQHISEGNDYDLILCDLMMPDETGMDVYAWIEKNRPGLERRMVFMTGGPFTPRATEFLQQVQNYRIKKPFELDSVRRFVRERVESSGSPSKPTH